MQISKRLRAVADLVSPGSRLADVGTDHGYVPIFLMQEGRIPSAVAMDINRGPLERARLHIRQQGLEGRIETRLSDGLAELGFGEADAILIAGMGGMLTVRILENGKTALASAKELILQPQSDIREVRLFLEKNGFGITDENMIEEDGKFYTILRAAPAGGSEDGISGRMGTYGKNGGCPPDSCAGTDRDARELSLRYGPVLLGKKHPVLKKYLEREYSQLAQVREKLLGQAGEAAGRRRVEIEERLRLNRRALSGFQAEDPETLRGDAHGFGAEDVC